MFILHPPTGCTLHLFRHQSVSGRVKGTLPSVSETFVPGLRYPSQAHELWALIVESFRGWEQRVTEAAAAAGVSPVSARAPRLHCNPSTVVDPTDRLEDAGLVIRKANPADRRINVLIATPKGKQVRAELIARLFEPPEAFRRLPAKEQTRFRDVMLAAVTGTGPPPQRREPASKPSSTS